MQKNSKLLNSIGFIKVYFILTKIVNKNNLCTKFIGNLFPFLKGKLSS